MRTFFLANIDIERSNTAYWNSILIINRIKMRILRVSNIRLHFELRNPQGKAPNISIIIIRLPKRLPIEFSIWKYVIHFDEHRKYIVFTRRQENRSVCGLYRLQVYEYEEYSLQLAMKSINYNWRWSADQCTGMYA